MRNLKKYLAVVVAIAIMMTAMIPAFAADTTAATTIPTDAKICADLGVLKGSGSGVTTEYLAGSVDRMQAARLYLRLKGLEQDALATAVDAANFPDADKTNADGKKVMAYLKAHPENGFVGGDSGNFGPKDTMTAQAYYKVLLTALGYAQKTSAGVGDFDYKDTFTFAATKGLSKVATVTDFTRADFATASVEALKATVKGKTKTLVATLVEAGKIDKAAAIAAGLYVDVPEKIEVTSVAADNLKKAVVIFNSAIDKTTAENKDNYKIDGITFDSAKLSEDGTTVTLTLNDAEGVVFTNQKEYKITIDGLKDAAGNKIAKTDKFAFTPLDTTVPTVSNVEALGTKAVKIVFSEPIKQSTAATMSRYKIDGKAISGTVKYNFPDSVIVSTNMTVGEHKLSVDGIADFTTTPYKVNVKDIAFTVIEDKEAPVIESATAKDLTKVEVIFNEPVKWATKAYHTSDSKTAKIEFNDKKVTLTFTEANKMPASEVTVTLENVEDYSGNKAKREVAVTPVLDTERPTVVKAEFGLDGSNHKVTVGFSESVKSADATKNSNYTLKDKDGKVYTKNGFTYEGHPAVALTYNDDKKEVTFTLNGTVGAGTYTLEVSGIMDRSFIGNTMMPYSTTIEVKDSSAPIISQVWAKNGVTNGTKFDNEVYVRYSEDMATEGTGSVLEYTKYSYKVGTGGSWLPIPKDADVSLYSSDTVVLKFTADSDLGALTPTKYLRVSLVSDKDENFVAGYYAEKEITAKSFVKINDAKATAKDTVEVEFNGVLTYTEASDFKADGKSVSYSSQTTKDGKTTVVFTLSTPFTSSDITSGQKFYADRSSQGDVKSQDAYGSLVANGQSNGVTIKDAIAPEVVDTTAGGDEPTKPFVLLKDASNNYVVRLKMDEAVACVGSAEKFVEVKLNSDSLKVNAGDVTPYTDGTSNYLDIKLGTVIRKDDGTIITGITSGLTLEVNIKSENESYKLIKDFNGDVAVKTFTKASSIGAVVPVVAGVTGFVGDMNAAATAAIAADLAAATAEAAKYADTATIANTASVNADVTADVKKLTGSADTLVGVKISIASPDYLKVVDGVVTLTKKNASTTTDATEIVTLTFTKGTQSVTKDVTVTIAHA